MKRASKFSRGKSEIVTKIIYFIFFVLMALIFLFPFYYTILLSFTSTAFIRRYEINSIFDFFTVNGTAQFDTWANIIQNFSIVTPNDTEANLLVMLWNSTWFTFLKVFCSLLASTLLAYAVCKFEFPGKKLIYVTVVFVQTIPLFGSGATSFKVFNALNMVDNPALFWLAWCSGFDFTFIIMHGVFSGISNSYSEAAKIDGASNLRILFSIILPLVVPTLVALFVTNALTAWNDYSTVMIYLRDFPTLSYGLYQFQQIDNGSVCIC